MARSYSFKINILMHSIQMLPEILFDLFLKPTSIFLVEEYEVVVGFRVQYADSKIKEMP
jgi:hypothetical protein